MMTKTQNAQPMGTYKPTDIDAKKEAADFRVISLKPYVIRWNDGRQETVTKRQLDKLQIVHSWATDF